MRASLCAVAVIAAGAPSLARMRRKKSPSGDWLLNRAFAARRNASAARLFTCRVFTLKTLPPLMSLCGHSPSHEANADALRNSEISRPIPDRVRGQYADTRNGRQVDSKNAVEVAPQIES